MNLENVAQAVLETFDLKGFEIDRNLALRTIKNDLINDLNDLNSNETLESRCDHFNIEGTGPSDYKELVLELNGNKIIIAGIRHFSGNKNNPFISMIPSFKLESKEEALEALKKKNFKVFSPKSLSFWSDNNKYADFVGSIYMLSTASEMKALSPWKEESEVRFEKISDNSFYDWYIDGYKEFHLEWPKLKEKVRANDLEDMKNSLLYYVYFKDQKIGLIEAIESEFLGHSGLYFNEIFISKKWKGQGLAKAIQRKFVDQITQGHEFVWGTIDSNNLPSYKTAVANGRKPIRFECFVNLD